MARSTGQVLLMEHKSRWDLPKGHADPGETIMETALRETEEETGIEAEAIEVDQDFKFEIEYDVNSKKRGKYHKRTTYFFGRIAEPVEIQLTEHIGYKWMDWPIEKNFQAQTLDPLFAALRKHLG